MKEILFCASCKKYSIHKECPACKKRTIKRVPAKFSFPDSFAKMRLKEKREGLSGRGLI